MSREDIIRMAQMCDLGRVCGPLDTLLDHEWEDLHRFAALVAAAKVAEYQDILELQQRSYEREIQIEVEAEREACAQIADAESSIEGIAQRIAAAIRARNNT